jgi:hypothetical protein
MGQLSCFKVHLLLELFELLKCHIFQNSAVLEYKEHNASLRDNSSFRNTNVYRPPGLRGQGAAVAVGGGAVAGTERGTPAKGRRGGGGPTRETGPSGGGGGGAAGQGGGKSNNKRGGNKMTVWRPGDAAQVDESGDYVQPVIPVVHTSSSVVDDTGGSDGGDGSSGGVGGGGNLWGPTK